MITITIKVDCTLGQALGIKEHIAMICEEYGDTRVVSITEEEPKQMAIDMMERRRYG